MGRLFFSSVLIYIYIFFVSGSNVAYWIRIRPWSWIRGLKWFGNMYVFGIAFLDDGWSTVLSLCWNSSCGKEFNLILIKVLVTIGRLLGNRRACKKHALFVQKGPISIWWFQLVIKILSSQLLMELNVLSWRAFRIDWSKWIKGFVI